MRATDSASLHILTLCFFVSRPAQYSHPRAALPRMLLLMPSFLRVCCYCSFYLFPAAAFAHGDVNTQPWLDGILHVITSPLCIALLLGLALVALSLDEQQHYRVSAVAGIGAVTALLLGEWLALNWNSSGARVASSLAAACLGGVAAAGSAVHRRWIMLLAACAGGAVCAAAELERFYWQSMLSMGITVMVLISCFSVGLRDARRLPWVERHLSLAARIAGAWIACLGLLLLALAIRVVLR